MNSHIKITNTLGNSIRTHEVSVSFETSLKNAKTKPMVFSTSLADTVAFVHNRAFGRTEPFTLVNGDYAICADFKVTEISGGRVTMLLVGSIQEFDVDQTGNLTPIP